MPDDLPPKIAFWLYNLIWSCTLPWLRLNHRLAEGFHQRSLKAMPPAADLWIQAASVGESYLAIEIIKTLEGARPVDILVTSNTSQGIDILSRALAAHEIGTADIHVSVGYFPFDKPALMRKAVAGIRPAVTVLLETEIWPGLLHALKTNGCKTIIINGRITAKSLKRYLLWPSIWLKIRPDRVWAISQADADRFEKLFGEDGIEVMPNIKFDRIASATPAENSPNKVKKIVPRDLAFVVLASVRRQEEPLVQKIVQEVIRNRPETVIGLFPRHVHRIPAWQEAFNRAGIRWSLRSETTKPATAGRVILWDTFGELLPAYQLCNAAFVGGSLAPLGGQNFLEALVSGVKPVIGRSWENFSWVGQEISASGLLRIVRNWQEVAALLLEDIDNPASREDVINSALEYIKAHQGGTAEACRHIEACLQKTATELK
jgi:3-deoxy-D-manno-octulosonic-acid transferase